MLLECNCGIVDVVLFRGVISEYENTIHKLIGE